MRIARGKIEQYSQAGAGAPIVISGTLGDLNASELGRPEQGLSVEIQVGRDNRGIHLSGTIESTLRLACDRCTQLFDLVATGKVDVILSEEMDTRNRTGETRWIHWRPGAEHIDLAELLKEALVLEIPQKLLCRATCKGLCPQCGNNFNDESCSCRESEMDDRWAALQDIKRKLEQA